MRDLALQVRDLLVATEHYRQAVATAIGAGTHETTTLVQLYLSGPLTPTAIAESLGMTSASVTGLLDRLAAAGYLTRSPNPHDRRSILVSLTPAGESTGCAIVDRFAEDVTAALDGTGTTERDALVLLLNQLTAALRRGTEDFVLRPRVEPEIIARDSTSSIPEKSRLPD